MEVEDPKVFVVYLNCSGMSALKTEQVCGEMQYRINKSISKDDERWLVLASDRTAVEYLTLEPLTLEKAKEFIETQNKISKIKKDVRL